MKRIRRVSAVLSVLVLLAMFATPASALPEPASQPGYMVTPLYAGKDIEAGVVAVWNSATKMFVQLRTTPEWLISEVSCI